MSDGTDTSGGSLLYPFLIFLGPEVIPAFIDMPGRAALITQNSSTGGLWHHLSHIRWRRSEISPRHTGNKLTYVYTLLLWDFRQTPLAQRTI